MISPFISLQHEVALYTMIESFGAWKDLTRYQLHTEIKSRRVVRRLYYIKLQRAISQLEHYREYTKQRTDDWKQHLYDQIMKRYFNYWKRVHRNNLLERRKISFLYTIKIIVMRKIFYQWKSWYIQCMKTEHQHIESGNLYTQKIVAATFQSWKKYQKYKMLQQQNVSAFRTNQNQLVVLRSWNHWKQSHFHHIFQTYNTLRADGHYQNTLLSTAFQHWIQYVGINRWNQILHNRAQYHYNRVLIHKAFQRYKTRIIQLIQYRAQISKALHYWKCTMEHTFFTQWRVYVRYRQQKRENTHNALICRQQQFLKLGLKAWLQGGFIVKQHRMQTIIEHSVQRHKRILQLVLQIASHWRYITKRNRSSAQNSDPPPQLRALNVMLNTASPSEYTKRLQQKRISAKPQPLHHAMQDNYDPFTTRQHNAHVNDDQCYWNLPESIGKQRLQPRKPMDLLGFDILSTPSYSDTTASIQASNERTSLNALHDVAKYGIQFQVPHGKSSSHVANTIHESVVNNGKASENALYKTSESLYSNTEIVDGTRQNNGEADATTIPTAVRNINTTSTNNSKDSTDITATCADIINPTTTSTTCANTIGANIENIATGIKESISSSVLSLADIEACLHYWYQKREECKIYFTKYKELKAHIKELGTEEVDAKSMKTNAILKTTLEMMEQMHAKYVLEWQDSKLEIEMLAKQLNSIVLKN